MIVEHDGAKTLGMPVVVECACVKNLWGSHSCVGATAFSQSWKATVTQPCPACPPLRNKKQHYAADLILDTILVSALDIPQPYMLLPSVGQ